MTILILPSSTFFGLQTLPQNLIDMGYKLLVFHLAFFEFAGLPLVVLSMYGYSGGAIHRPTKMIKWAQSSSVDE